MFTTEWWKKSIYHWNPLSLLSILIFLIIIRPKQNSNGPFYLEWTLFHNHLLNLISYFYLDGLGTQIMHFFSPFFHVHCHVFLLSGLDVSDNLDGNDINNGTEKKRNWKQIDINIMYSYTYLRSFLLSCSFSFPFCIILRKILQWHYGTGEKNTKSMVNW